MSGVWRKTGSTSRHGETDPGRLRGVTGDAALFFLESVNPLPDVEQFHRRGRVLVLDVDNRRVDATHDRLPDNVQARRAEEVGTVGLVSCEENLSGYYIPYLVRGYNHSCRVQLVALPSRQMIANIGTSLSPPDSVRLPFWNRHAPRPNQHLAEQRWRAV